MSYLIVELTQYNQRSYSYAKICNSRDSDRSPVISRITCEPSSGRARKIVAIVAGYRSFRTFRDCHTSIAFTTVGAQPNLAHIFG